jgi:hypothetical protein
MGIVCSHSPDSVYRIFPDLLVRLESKYIGSGLRRDHEIHRAMFAM